MWVTRESLTRTKSTVEKITRDGRLWAGWPIIHDRAQWADGKSIERLLMGLRSGTVFICIP